MHILGGHKTPVSALAVHPSGKMCMSVSRDHSLKVWNLVQGRCSFTRNLKPLTPTSTPTSIKWLKPSATLYLLLLDRRIDIHSTIDNACQLSYTHSHRVNQADFIPMFVGLSSEEKQCVVYVAESKVLEVVGMDGIKVNPPPVSHLHIPYMHLIISIRLF